MANLKSVDSSNFETEVLQAPVPVLVDFWASWCPPCRALAPTLEELAVDEPTRLRIVKVSVEEERELPEKFGVRNIPTLILFKGGEAVARMVGNRTKKALLREIEAYL
ncbi:MAG: Thioredoxin C-1 [Chloroflexi bacterium ADurb.Bin360]|nr:MAG: Thioredoxin C-1 [Chloroflexi bacterium ADurb.Bin360]